MYLYNIQTFENLVKEAEWEWNYQLNPFFKKTARENCLLIRGFSPNNTFSCFFNFSRHFNSKIIQNLGFDARTISLVFLFVNPGFPVKFLEQVYSEPCQTSKMEYFAKIVYSLQVLIIFAKCTILYAWQGSEYSFALNAKIFISSRTEAVTDIKLESLTKTRKWNMAIGKHPDKNTLRWEFITFDFTLFIGLLNFKFSSLLLLFKWKT